MHPPSPTRPLRLWPALAVASLAALALAVLWAWPEMPRQRRYLATAGILAASGGLLVFWLLFLSRLRGSVRLASLATLLLCGGLLAASFRIRGVDGDLLPIIEPRWKNRTSIPALALSNPPASSDPLQTSAAVEPAAAANLNTNQFASNFPQFYGPHRNGVIPNLELDPDWNTSPPKILWRHPVGAAWAGFAIQDGLAITLEQRGDSEYVIAYNLLTGTPVWTHADSAKYSTTIAGEGPRTTPTISHNRVFTFGATGLLNCFDLRTGKLIWTKDTARENDARVPDWGFAGSPLVVDEKVVVSVGGSNGRSMVAYSITDGQVAWTSGDGGADYSSPILADFLGTPQIVEFGRDLVGRALDGRELWRHPWKAGHPRVSLPLIVSSNQFLASSGYGAGAELVSLSRTPQGAWATSREWKSIALKSKFGPIFRVGEYIYGLDDGIFCCVDLKTGERKWKDGRYGHGQGLLVGNLILLTSEKGELVLINPDPQELVELARFPVFTGKTWNPPALAGEYLLLRNDTEAACLQLKMKNWLENI